MTKDHLFAGIGFAAVAALLAPLAIIVATLAEQGLAHLSWSFLWAAPLEAGTGGGIGPIIVSSFLLVGLCLLFALPLGLGCALYLSELVPAGTRAARWLGFVLDSLAAVPSIVFGLFGYQLFATTLGLGFSLLSGGLTLACMVLPLMIRSIEQALRLTPARVRLAGAALALGRWGMIRRVLLPAALPSIAGGVILSVGRALAETAALLFTAGYVLRMPGSLLDSGRALAVHVYDLAMNVPGGLPAASATALVLMALLIVINAGVRRLSARFEVRMS